MSENKIWNEHVRFFATFLNLVGVGVFGLAVIGPMIEHYQKSGAVEFSPFSVILWEMVGVALIFKFFAHVTLRLMKSET